MFGIFLFEIKILLFEFLEHLPYNQLVTELLLKLSGTSHKQYK